MSAKQGDIIQILLYEVVTETAKNFLDSLLIRTLLSFKERPHHIALYSATVSGS